MSARAVGAVESFGRVFAVSRFTLREGFHRRSFLVGGLVSLAWLAVPALLGWAFFSNLSAFGGSLGGGQPGEEAARRLATSIVVATAVGGLSFIAVLVTVFLGSGSIAGEISRGTILAVVARPIARWELVVGKLAGILAAAVVLFTVTSAGSVVVAGLLTGVWITDAPQGIALLELNLAVMAAVSVAASARLSGLVATVLVLVTYFGITNLDKLYLFGLFLNNDLLQQAAIWGRLALPVGEVSDLAAGLLSGPLSSLTEGLVRGVRGGFEPRPWIVLYSAVYLGAAVVAACLGLSRRDVR